MEKSPLSFLLVLCTLLCIISTTIADPPKLRHSKSATKFIWSSCRTTRYPALCYHCLSGYDYMIQQSERKLALIALAVSLSQAKSTAKFVSKMSNAKGIKHRELEAVKDCLDTMGDSVDQLSRSFKELGHMGHTNGEEFMWHMSNVQTWVSAALTDDNTCMEGFSGHVMSGKVKATINPRVTKVAQVTSNALALVNNFASSATHA